MGTICERIRSAGAGIPAFYTRTGAGTLRHKGGMPLRYKKGSKGKVIEKFSEARESKVFNGKEYVLEHAL